MTHNEQLELWVQGKSIHNTERDECVPDFSCCDPKLQADEKTRKAFVAAGEELRMSFLGIFLSKMMKTEKANVYLAGFDNPEETIQ